MADAWVGLGRALSRTGKLEYAEAAFRTAIEADAEHPAARYRLSMTLWATSRFDEAMAEMTALTDDGDYSEAHERLAVWSYYVGDHAEAWRHVHRARALGQDVPAQLIPLLQQHMLDPGAEPHAD